MATGAVSAEEYILPAGGDVNITQQEVLVAVGRGIQQKENLEVAEELAGALGGACSSPPVIDQGWLPATRQVGKSGMAVKPRCFIALGIGRAPEHVEGMKDSDLIVAVNTDPNAPIFDVAHYGFVGDLLDLARRWWKRSRQDRRSGNADRSEVFWRLRGGVAGGFRGRRLGGVRAAMSHLIRILAQGQKENRFDRLGLRLATFIKEVMFQTRFLHGEPIIRWANPLIFWGFCFFVVASAMLFVGGIVAPWLWIPQAETIPLLGTAIDVFAVLVLVGLIASSIRRYVFTPAGLQRTADATIVVSLIAALMVTYLLAEAGGRVESLRTAAAGHAGSNTAARRGFPRPGRGQGDAGRRRRPGVDRQDGRDRLVAARRHPLFLLVYLPYSKHMHLMWRRLRCSSPSYPTKARCAGSGKAGRHGADVAAGPITWRMLMNAYACAECGRCERGLPGGGQRLDPLAPGNHPRLKIVRLGQEAGKRQRTRQPAAWSSRRRSGHAPPVTPASIIARSATNTSP